jgi:hypothetical protein
MEYLKLELSIGSSLQYDQEKEKKISPWRNSFAKNFILSPTGE